MRFRTTDEVELAETLCNRVMAVQAESGLNKSRFAEAIGVSAQYLAMVASYQRTPSHAVLQRISQVFGIPMDYFYHGARITSTPLARAVLGRARRQEECA